MEAESSFLEASREFPGITDSASQPFSNIVLMDLKIINAKHREILIVIQIKRV